MAKALILLADGFEETEAIATVDILRRAGIQTTMSGVSGSMVTGRSKIRVYSDSHLMDTETTKYDCLIIPGGGASVEAMLRDNKLLELIRNFYSTGKVVAAICAGPLVLVKAGILKDKKATIFPGMEKNLDRPRAEKVVVDENIITSQGPGTAVEFGLKIVEVLLGKPSAQKIRQEIVA